jgi:hypothetical protein
VVEELLQLLVGVVDAQLLKRVQLGEEEEKKGWLLYRCILYCEYLWLHHF